MIEVIAINYGMEVLLMSDDTNIPITEWLDFDGGECSNDDATVCVAGPDVDGKWYSEVLENFDETAVH